jgi:hypothetical protein
VAAVFLAAVAFASMRWHRRQQVVSAFPEVTAGQTEGQVAALLGQPEWVVTPRPSHWCDDTPVSETHATAEDRECVRQWAYRNWPGPACFTVCFGSNGRVVSTYHYVSP